MLLTLDLARADGEKRESFYKTLTARGWSKLPDLTTAWTKPLYAATPEVLADPGLLQATAATAVRSDLVLASLSAKLVSYRAAVQVGLAEVIEL